MNTLIQLQAFIKMGIFCIVQLASKNAFIADILTKCQVAMFQL
jgi:hypothetical protein